MRIGSRRLNIWIVLLVCLVIIGGAAVGGLIVWSAQNPHVSVAAADPGPWQVQAEGVSVQPPAGIDADPVAQPVNMPADPNQAMMVKRGMYLAVAGDCQYCHSIPGGPPFAGGQPVQTPFGDLFSPNITPNRKYGIGRWTDAQFYDALHNGIGPGRSVLIFPHYLYPLMPWQSFSQLSYPDIMAIKAYLESIQPVAQKNRPSRMAFPFTIRAGLLAWRLLFFRQHPIQYDPSWSPQVRNGAFLVEALGHCSMCHTQRNILLATKQSRFLAGGHILAQSWYAPDIGASKSDGVGGWPAQTAAQYLFRDGALGPGSPYGPMKEVVDDSLSRLPPSDVQDIVAFLQQGAPDLKSETWPRGASAPAAAAGAQLYADNCARCHGANGKGVDNNFPNLAGNQSIWNGPPHNIISMILGGFRPWHKDQSGMPAFGPVLSDNEVAAIANFVRTSWGNRGVADATPLDVATERGLASNYVTLSTGSAEASFSRNGQTSEYDDISGKFELFSQHINCMMDADIRNDDPKNGAPPIRLFGACARGGGAFIGSAMIAGRHYPVLLQVSDITGGAHLRELMIYGRPAGSGADLALRISLVTPTD